MSTFHALSAPSHTCSGCGRCCESVVVKVPTRAERERIEALAVTLGVERPIHNHEVRFHEGRCVFLDDERRCRIHARFGLEAKPRVCRQFPLVVVETEAGVRVGIDPSCYHAHAGEPGEPLQVEHRIENAAHLPPAAHQAEASLVALLGAPEATVGGVLHALAGQRPDPAGGLPPGMATRWLERLQAADLGRFLVADDLGPGLRHLLGRLLSTAGGTDPAAPPPWPAIPPELEQRGLAAVRNLLYLRTTVSVLPVPPATALLGLLGVVLAGWTTREPLRFSELVAAWTRCLRAPAFAHVLAPDPATLASLAGQGG